MNPIIETILQHRSIRKFEERPLSDEQIRTIVECAQSASTSSFIQAYSIIGVKDREKKRVLAELAGNQSYVENSGHFFVFCADLHRHERIGEMEETDVSGSLESMEKFMVAIIDASLAAQNASLAAESMGLGICYIGGIRNNMEQVTELLGIPTNAMPLFGLAVGYPAQQTDTKPRLPFDHVYHEDTYNMEEISYKEQLEDYNKTTSAYYLARTGGKRSDTWTNQMANMLREPKRTGMKDFVKKQGLAKR